MSVTMCGCRKEEDMKWKLLAKLRGVTVELGWRQAGEVG